MPDDTKRKESALDLALVCNNCGVPMILHVEVGQTIRPKCGCGFGAFTVNSFPKEEC